MRKFQRSIIIALAIFFCGEGAMAAVQGTSVTVQDQGRANVVPDGVRVGWFEVTSTTLNPARKLGVWMQPVVRWQWDAPVAATSNSYCNNFTWSNCEASTDCTNFSSVGADVARTVVFYVNWSDAAASTEGVTVTMTVTGTDIWDHSITSTFNIDASSPSVTRHETPKTFKTISGISWASLSMTGLTSAGITWDIGYGYYLGLPYCMHEDTRVLELVDADGTGGCLKDSAGSLYLGAVDYAATDGDYCGRWAPSTALDGTADFVLYYVITDLKRLWGGYLERPAY